MQCATHGCEYPRELYKGRFRTSCCHRCRYTNGQEHNAYCVAYTSSSHRRSRSSSPSSTSSSRSSSREAVVPQVRERHRHCFVITLGLRGHFGMQLLEHNPDLRSNAIDARSLRDLGADHVQLNAYGIYIVLQRCVVRVRVENDCTVKTRRFLLLFRRGLGRTRYVRCRENVVHFGSSS